MRDLARPHRGPVDFVDLVAEAGRGAPWAVDALAAEYHRRLVDFARVRGAAEPEGIADVALTMVLQRLPDLRFESREAFWAYLCLTARSRLIDEHRRQRPVELTGDPERIEGVGPVDDPFDDQVADRHYVRSLLDPLTDEQRRVLELRFLEDLSVEETADRTGRSRGAVKTMQRRAINAILAAVALAIVVLAVRGLGDGSAGTEADLDQAPVDRSEGTESIGPDRSDDQEVLEVADPEEGRGDDGVGRSPTGSDREADQAGDATEDDPIAGDGVDDGPAPIGPGEAGAALTVTLSTGTTDATAMNTSGLPGEARLHGVRIRCVGAELSHDDPIDHPDQLGRAPAQIHWGGTGTGAGTCDGGITDRSAYWMPALFDRLGRVAVPDTILVEYKSFGGPGFDRTTIRPIPTGLRLVADPTVAASTGRVGGASAADDGTVKIDIAFPTCVRVDGAGQPVRSSGDRVDHLSYPSPEDGRADECPATHPYRIPQLGYRLTYPVPYDSDWTLASDPTRPGPAATVTARAIAGWEPGAMGDVVTCVRDLLEDCWFAPLDRPAVSSEPDPSALASFAPGPPS